VLERINELNPTLNAFISVFEGDAMEQARAFDEELRQVDRAARCMAARFPSKT
jgi:Asp-tRNA(Asn)/Glu-tRNA(Gln) amidotransferase A subunit family amidase